MKNISNHFIQFFIFSFVLLSNVIMYGQPGDTDGTLEGLEGDDALPAAAPIDDYLWLLMLVGLVFVFFKYRAYLKQQNA